MRGFFFNSGRQNRFCCLCGSHAFSLVEVVLALGIATFGILVIVALLPVGIKSTKDSLEETGAINVLSQVIANQQATPFGQPCTNYGLPALTNTMTTPQTNTFGISDSNPSIASSLNGATYRVDYVITPPVVFTPPATNYTDPYHIWFKVSWPAQSTNAAGSVESVVTFPQP